MDDQLLHIYGSSQCAACKTAVSVAQKSGVSYEYHLIDQTPEAALAFAEYVTVVGSRALPLSVFGDTVVAGLPDTLGLIREVA